MNLVKVFLGNEGFMEIKTPILFEGTVEGSGASVLSMNYYGQPAFFAQSAQIPNQMALCGDFQRVFSVGPVFRANTSGHMCEITGLDVEMKITGSYFELMDVVDRLFVGMFDKINERCQNELEAIGNQYPFQPLKYSREKNYRLAFQQGVELLKDAGVVVDPLADLDMESERKLGEIVLKNEGTDFFMMYRYPLAARPFHTMPCPKDEAYSNSFVGFLRGERIISGAQRVHVPELLESRATECGIDLKNMPTYTDIFRYGAAPRHGGFGFDIERVVKLFCALADIGKTLFFPFDT